MNSLLRPPALVTVLTITPYQQVNLERFEADYEMRPVWTNPERVYSTELHREGFTITQLGRSSPIDIATWLHRSGMWDTLPAEA